jgi:Mg-chelatase subunit ChlD
MDCVAAGIGKGRRMRFLSPAWLLAVLAVPPLLLLTWRTIRRNQGLSRRRRRAFTILRVGSVLFLALALAGFALARASDRLSVLFLLDQSRSVSPEQRSRALSLIETVRGKLGRGDSATLVRFGGDAELEELAPGRPVAEEGGDLELNTTNIANALQFGLAEAAGSSPPRVVLLTDGNENRGSADQAARIARSLGARIYPVPLGSAAAPNAVEVSVEDLRAPASVRQNEPQEVVVMIRSRTRTRARVTLLQDAAPAASRDEVLTPGENAVSFTGSFPERGLHAWDALVSAQGDELQQNNHARRFVSVSGAPQVLYVSRPGRQSPSLLAALAAQGITAVRRDPAGLPGTLAGYLPYDAIILDNVPGYGISTEKMETIARFVRDAGGGLLMAGGDNSFGAGGYYKTPIERVLPVDMDVKSRLDLPRISLVLLIDKSGSMGGTVSSGESKLDVVKSAALSAIESLNAFDRVGLLAFDADWEWAVPLTDAGDTAAIVADLATLAPGGGTIMYPALEEADRVLEGSSTSLKHVIVLTDGLTNAGDFEALVKKMARNKITVSTVAVGEDADAGLLGDIARWGGGRTYATSDPRDVPQIFMMETKLASQGLLVEQGFLPQAVSAGESMRGIDFSGMPALKGFVLTYVKTGAEMALSALYGAPLLAMWHYGLGRTAAFTSDFQGRWSAALLGWDQFPRFAAQLVRWIEKPPDSGILHPRIEIAGGRAAVTVDAWDAAGVFSNGLLINGILLGPPGDRAEVVVPQTGPGLYEATLPADSVGDYTLTLSARSGDAGGAPMTLGASVPYSDEYRMLGVNADLLGRLASETGGRVISGTDAQQVLRDDRQALAELLRREPGAAAAGDSAWWYLVLAALILFFFDIVVRRIAIPEGFGALLSARLSSLRGRPGYSYDELSGMVARGKEEQKAKLRQRVSTLTGGGKVDPELAAYLYIARLRSRRAAEEKEKQ